MKKLFSVILVVCMLCSVLAFNAGAAYADDFSASGKAAYQKLNSLDANGDGAIGTEDASVYLKAAAGIISGEGADYDRDGDGYVTVSDAQAVLRVAAGIDSALTEEETLALFNDSINEVKSTRPGFERIATVHCPSIKITTMNAPIDTLNVTSMEFSAYVDRFVDTMNSPGYSLFLNDEMRAELKQMQAEAKEAYEPHTEEKYVAKTSNAHYSYFPVTNLGWSSKLTVDDIESISCTLSDSVAVFTIEMAKYTYIGDEYPTGTAGFAARQALPYGKVFNIPAFDESDGSTINKVTFYNGKVEYHLDISTGAPVFAEYSYSYDTDVTAAPQEKSSMVMKTVSVANVTETYNINKVAE